MTITMCFSISYLRSYSGGAENNKSARNRHIDHVVAAVFRPIERPQAVSNDV